MEKQKRELVLNVHAKDFMITCDEDLARYLKAQIDELSGGTGKIDLKTLVDAYLKLSCEKYKNAKKLDNLEAKLNLFKEK